MRGWRKWRRPVSWTSDNLLRLRIHQSMRSQLRVRRKEMETVRFVDKQWVDGIETGIFSSVKVLIFGHFLWFFNKFYYLCY